MKLLKKLTKAIGLCFKKQTEVMLFLDDLRHPREAYSYTKQDMFIKKKWHIVRDYEEFCEFIITHGIPDFISFDHDLADTHYTPPHLWDDYKASKAWQDAQVHQEKTGYDCAKWLVDHCEQSFSELPGWYVHSMNPVGADNIKHYLINYQNFLEKNHAKK
jgi:hypothetical protein